MKIGVIVQARMSSTRLPGKVLLKLCGKPVLEILLAQVKKAETIDEIIVATSVNPEDAPIMKLAGELSVKCYAGSLDDVLDRYYQAAKQNRLDAIVRVTGDCPFIDPHVIDLVVRKFLDSGVDYASNVDPPTYPDGLDTEVFTFKALEDAWKNAAKPFEREHVTPYIRNKPANKKINVRNAIDLSEHRWTIDRPEDLEFANKVFAHFSGKQEINLEGVLKIVLKHPEYTAINRHIARNEKCREE